MCPKQLISVMIVILSLIGVPVVAFAVDVTVTVGTTDTMVSTPCSTPPVGVDTSTTPGCVDISGTYGLVTIDPGAQVVALRGDTENQLVVQGTNITNNDASPATVTITYKHRFLAVVTNVPRSYGLSISGNFSPAIGRLASGDQVTMNGSVTYFASESSGSAPIITGSPNPTYTVPFAGSSAGNNYGPNNPTQPSGQIICTSVLETDSCQAVEVLKSQVTTLLASGDANSLPGSAHTVSATTPAALASVLAALTAKIDVDLPDSGEEENEGRIRVTLFGNDRFDVQGVDYSQVVFGPGMARVSGRPHFRDVDGDGVLDAVLKFEADDAKINCSDKIATLRGVGTFGDRRLHFSASDGLQPRRCHEHDDDEDAGRR